MAVGIDFKQLSEYAKLCKANEKRIRAIGMIKEATCCKWCKFAFDIHGDRFRCEVTERTYPLRYIKEGSLHYYAVNEAFLLVDCMERTALTEADKEWIMANVPAGGNVRWVSPQLERLLNALG